MAASSKSRTSVEQVEMWRKHVEGWKRSGLSQDAYCKKNGLSKSTLGYWRRRLAQEKADECEAQTVVPVPCRLIPQQNVRAGALQLHVGERYRVDIPDDFSPAALKKLLRTLSRLP